MNRNFKKTGVNSARRKMERDHQDSRRFMVAGVALGLLFLVALIFGGSPDVIKQDHPSSVDPAPAAGTKDAVRSYFRGVPDIDQMDSITNGDSGHK